MKLHNILKYINAIVSSTAFYVFTVLLIGVSPFLIFEQGFFPLCDSSVQLIHFVTETKRMLSSGMPYWSWNTFFGENFIGAYAYYTVTRPMVWIVCLLPYSWIPYCLLPSIAVELVLVALLTKSYLRMMGFSQRLCKMGGVMLALSSYTICALEYTMFYEPLLAFLVLLIMTERMLRSRAHAVSGLIFGVFIVAFINYYFMVSTLLVVAIYFLCRLGIVERDQRLRKFLTALGSILIGVSMSAVVLIPAIACIHGSVRAGFDITLHFSNILERLRSLFMPNGTDGRIPLYLVDTNWFMNTANLTIFGVMFVALYIKRNIKSWISVLTIVYLVMYLSPINGVFSLFTASCYTRWVYGLDIAMILCTLSYFRDNFDKKVPLKYTLVYSAVCIAVYIALVGSTAYLKRMSTEFDSEWLFILIVTIIFLFNMIGLFVVNQYKIATRSWYICFFVVFGTVAVMQLWLFYINHNTIGPYAKYPDIDLKECYTTADFDAGRKFTARHDYLPCEIKTNFRANAPLYNNRPAISTYHSLRNPHTERFFNYTANGVINVFYEPLIHRQDVAALMSVKEIEADNYARDINEYYDNVQVSIDEPHRKIYDFGYYIPMGMAYDKYMIDGEYIDDEKFRKGHNLVRAMLNALLVDTVTACEISKYAELSTFDDTVPLDSVVNARRRFCCNTFVGDTRGFTASIELPDTMPVFFSVASEKGFKCTLDGIPAKIHSANMGFSAVIVPRGNHTIRFEYTPPGLYTGAIISCLGVVVFVFIFLLEKKKKINKLIL